MKQLNSSILKLTASSILMALGFGITLSKPSLATIIQSEITELSGTYDSININGTPTGQILVSLDQRFTSLITFDTDANTATIDQFFVLEFPSGLSDPLFVESHETGSYTEGIDECIIPSKCVTSFNDPILNLTINGVDYTTSGGGLFALNTVPFAPNSWLLVSGGPLIVRNSSGEQVATGLTSINAWGYNVIPEPSSTLGLLVLGTLGAASTLKRKLKSSKPSEKATTKVS